MSMAAGIDDFNQYAVLAEAIRERNAARAEVLRQRALLDDLRACPSTIAAPRLIATSDDVNSWPLNVAVPRVTWDALHAIGRDEQVQL